MIQCLSSVMLCVCAAMSLAAEDDEEGRFHPMDPAMSRHFSNNRHRQQHTRSEASFFQPYSSRAGPLASIAHSFLSGGSHLDQEVLATLMADFDRAANAGSTAPGSGQQDLSYEALTNLEDVKLTAPPELLATMPLDMCLKGGQWEDKVHCSVQLLSSSSTSHRKAVFPDLLASLLIHGM